MKALLLLGSLFMVLSMMSEVSAENRETASEPSKPVFSCISLSEEVQGFKTAKNCKMADGTVTNVVFPVTANIEIIVSK